MRNSTRTPRRKTSVRQLWLPIDAAPQKVRDHGLGDAHSRPLVSPGKIGGEFGVSFRVAPWAAWLFPSLELRAENSYPALILDFDGRGSFERVMEEVKGAHVGDLNWGVENVLTGGVHGVWTLANPVHRAATALEAPLKLFARISEYYAAHLGADAGYTGVLTHNPMEAAPAAGLQDTLAPGSAVQPSGACRLYPLSVEASASLQDGGGPELRRIRALHVLGRLSGESRALRSWVRPIGSMTVSSTL